MSISDVPQFSTFAKRLGKTLKSTARIAANVTVNIAPLYVVTNGFLGSCSCGLPSSDSGFSEPPWAARIGEGRALFVKDFAGEEKYMTIAGINRKALSAAG